MKFKLPGKEGVSPNYVYKLSELVLEFAQEIASRDSPPNIFTNAVGLAVLLWNLPLLPEDAQAEAMNDIRRWLAEKGQLALQTEIARLLELRQTRYSKDRRMVMDYKLEYETKGPRLTVASLDMDRPENRTPQSMSTQDKPRRRRIVAELDALLPSVLDKAFKGEL